MNLVLLEAAELGVPLPLGDARARHILGVLRRGVGDELDAGVVDGPRGKARVESVSTEWLHLSFTPLAPPEGRSPLRLIVGLPRPQTARKVLGEATTLGVGALDFVRTDRGEPGYAQSTLWSSGEWRRHLLEGAQQAFCTRLPALTHGGSLEEVLAALPPAAECERIVLDNYESPEALSGLRIAAPGAVLALGSERGWTARERDLFRGAGFRLAHLGTRVLRTETAVVAAVTLALAKLGRL